MNIIVVVLYVMVEVGDGGHPLLHEGKVRQRLVMLEKILKRGRAKEQKKNDIASTEELEWKKV